MFNILIKGFESKEKAEAFLNWFESEGLDGLEEYLAMDDEGEFINDPISYVIDESTKTTPSGPLPKFEETLEMRLIELTYDESN